MANPKVELINHSKIIDDDEIESALPSLQTQVSRDFAPAWGINANLRLCREKKPSPAAWWLVFLNDSHHGGTLGYHELTDEGLPLAKVFTRTIRKYEKYGYTWTMAASHELLEMLADPDLNLYARHGDAGLMYAYEVCDPCEQVAYKIGKNQVSDFVYPAWFESFHKERRVQFDHRRHIRRPFQKLSGADVDTLNARIHKINHPRSEQEDSRKSRRGTPRDEWRVSSLKPGRVQRG